MFGIRGGEEWENFLGERKNGARKLVQINGSEQFKQNWENIFCMRKMSHAISANKWAGTFLTHVPFQDKKNKI